VCGVVILWNEPFDYWLETEKKTKDKCSLYTRCPCAIFSMNFDPIFNLVGLSDSVANSHRGKLKKLDTQVYKLHLTNKRAEKQ
jgi:hypothetical protein